MATAAPIQPADTETRHYPLVYPPPKPSPPRRRGIWKPQGPFPFLRLPFELRTEVLKHALLLPPECSGTIDLEHSNGIEIAPRLGIFLACKALHQEASRVFYGNNTFRIFPCTGSFIHSKTKHMLLAQLSPEYRAHIRSLELRVGPGWSAPPKGWRVTDVLGLQQCVQLQELRVFVECDHSDPIFNGFRGGHTSKFYSDFCAGLVRGILSQTQGVRDGRGVARVTIEHYPGVSRQGQLVTLLRAIIEACGKHVEFVGST